MQVANYTRDLQCYEFTFALKRLEHLHPAAERKALEKPFEAFAACNQFFLQRHSPTIVSFLSLHIEKVSGIFHVALT